MKGGWSSEAVPIFATLVVLVAVATMVGLGVWQLGRADEKEAALAAHRRNVRAAPVAVTRDLDLAGQPASPGDRASATGRSPTRLAGAGKFGFRVIADCAAGLGAACRAAGNRAGPAPPPGRAVPVSGYLAQAPDSRSLLRQLFDHRPAGHDGGRRPAARGLAAKPAADLRGHPQQSSQLCGAMVRLRAIALVIYALALRRRRRA
jgi:surfeit locus 1 family protein